MGMYEAMDKVLVHMFLMWIMMSLITINILLIVPGLFIIYKLFHNLWKELE